MVFAPDRDLIGRARDGDRDAYGELYRRYAPMVHGILLARVTPDLADDLLQEVFLKAMTELVRLRDDGAGFESGLPTANYYVLLYKKMLMKAEEAVFRAIAHPVRRNILGILASSPLSVKDLTAHFEMSQPAVSQHLKELREAELVACERDGLENRYRLTPHPLRYVIRWAEPYRTLIDPAGHHWAFEKVPGRPIKGKVTQGGRNGS